MNGDLAQVASQYAEALLELAEGSGSGNYLERLETIHRDLKAIAEVYNSNHDLSLVLNHPSLSTQDKKDLLLKTFGGKVDELTERLLRLLADRRRLEVLPDLEKPFAELLRRRKNIVSAQLTCSQKLSDKEVADIKARLSEHLGKKLELDVEVDESLIGGLVLRLGDQVIDGSIKGRLSIIEKTLLSV